MTHQQSVMLPKTQTVLRVDQMSALQFWQHCLLHDHPLHFRKGAIAWRSFQKWSLNYLKNALAETQVTLAKSIGGAFNYVDKNSSEQTPELHTMLFREAVEEVISSSTNSYNFSYIQQHPIAEKFPQLLKDIDRPQWLSPTKFLYVVNLWIGSQGCFSPLHFDQSDNFLVQVQGQKHVMLFSKQDSPFLYANSISGAKHISMLDLRCPDHNRFPLFTRAKPYSALLEPGDVIYIPRKWWHAVESMDTAISINYWWGGIRDVIRNNATWALNKL
jgi:hypothetical protein